MSATSEMEMANGVEEVIKEVARPFAVLLKNPNEMAKESKRLKKLLIFVKPQERGWRGSAGWGHPAYRFGCVSGLMARGWVVRVSNSNRGCALRSLICFAAGWKPAPHQSATAVRCGFNPQYPTELGTGPRLRLCPSQPSPPPGPLLMRGHVHGYPVSR